MNVSARSYSGGYKLDIDNTQMNTSDYSTCIYKKET